MKCFGMSHLRERSLKLDVLHLGKHSTHEPLRKFQNLLLPHESDLHVQLSKLWLAVGPEVLVSETAGNLIVAVNARDHEHLLEELRALRQRVPLP
jgi:hypothetical protein